ncbi:hypothetical protein EV278_105135 [Caulobacter sp. BK020]|nr:hypothetical protein EV278_105135 [Caulobacter sp. BK020]
MVVTAGFRRGLDADVVPLMMRTRAWEWLAIAGLLGLLGVPFIILAWWLAGRLGRWGVFPLLAAGPPVLLMFANQAYWIIDEALEPPMNIKPFEANSWTYLPNWLELAGIALSFLFAAVAYTKLAQAMRGSRLQ